LSVACFQSAKLAQVKAFVQERGSSSFLGVGNYLKINDFGSIIGYSSRKGAEIAL